MAASAIERQRLQLICGLQYPHIMRVVRIVRGVSETDFMNIRYLFYTFRAETAGSVLITPCVVCTLFC